MSVLFRSNGTTAQPLVLTEALTASLWDRMRRFPILFATQYETTFSSFRAILGDRRTILVAFRRGENLLGLGMVYGITPGSEAQIQVTFFDGKLKGKEAIGRAFIVWVFGLLPVNRVSAPMRADAQTMIRYLERIGLVFEGCKRHYFKITPLARGQREQPTLCDLFLYGVTREDAETLLWQRGHAKPPRLVHFRYDIARDLASGIGRADAIEA